MIRTYAVVTVALLVLHMPSGVTEAAEKCMTKNEARALYRTSYLYWHRQGAQRCWSSRRGERIGPYRSPRQAVVVPRQPPPPIPMMAVPFDLPDLMPPWFVPRSRFDPGTSLAWAAQARVTGSDLEHGPVFSSFPGEQPDVWPILPQPEPANVAGIAVVTATALLAFGFGLAGWRWHRNRLHLTNFQNGNSMVDHGARRLHL